MRVALGETALSQGRAGTSAVSDSPIHYEREHNGNQ